MTSNLDFYLNYDKMAAICSIGFALEKRKTRIRLVFQNSSYEPNSKCNKVTVLSILSFHVQAIKFSFLLVTRYY